MQKKGLSGQLDTNGENTTMSVSKMLDDVLKRWGQTLNWQLCPQCRQEWSLPAMHSSGICIPCFEENVRKNKRIERREALLREFIGGVKGLEEFTFERFKVCKRTEQAYNSCLQFKPRRQNFFLWGPCGMGKTHLAHAAGRSHILSGASAISIKPPELGRKFRMIPKEEYESKLRAFTTSEILIIDDLGIGKETEKFLEVLYEIIDRRILSKQNGLIITSNLSLADLSEKLNDDRLPSRIMELCKIIKVQGEVDWRTTHNGGELW